MSSGLLSHSANLIEQLVDIAMRTIFGSLLVVRFFKSYWVVNRNFQFCFQFCIKPCTRKPFPFFWIASEVFLQILDCLVLILIKAFRHFIVKQKPYFKCRKRIGKQTIFQVILHFLYVHKIYFQSKSTQYELQLSPKTYIITQKTQDGISVWFKQSATDGAFALFWTYP